MKPQLYRADSTTLGSYFGHKKGQQRSPYPASTVKALRAENKQGVGDTEGARPPTKELALPNSAVDNIAPEIDDMDIFYQDLAQGLALGASGNDKPAVSAICVPGNEQTLVGPDDAAPPPPDIDCIPRQRPALSTR